LDQRGRLARITGDQPMSVRQSNGDPNAPAASSAGPSSGADEVECARRVAELEAEVSDLKDRLLRALAEQENARRRAERQRVEAVRFAASGLARDLLATLDNLRRAIETVPAEKAAGETVQRLLSGVAATERGLLDALEKHGIRQIDALGQRFDPDRHEAVYQVADAERPAGIVAEVLQPGYLHHDRLLRPAMVGVTAGGNGPVPEASDERDRGIVKRQATPSDRGGDRGANGSEN
jgi:molecular chaperone GrpE